MNTKELNLSLPCYIIIKLFLHFFTSFYVLLCMCVNECWAYLYCPKYWHIKRSLLIKEIWADKKRMKRIINRIIKKNNHSTRWLLGYRINKLYTCLLCYCWTKMIHSTYNGLLIFWMSFSCTVYNVSQFEFQSCCTSNGAFQRQTCFFICNSSMHNWLLINIILD